MPVSQQDVEKFVFDAMVSFGPEPDEVNRDATLESLDVDSLDLVELAQLVEDEYGVLLQPDDFEGINTVGKAIDAIAAKVQ
jgi:acyl carrier protein